MARLQTLHSRVATTRRLAMSVLMLAIAGCASTPKESQPGAAASAPRPSATASRGMPAIEPRTIVIAVDPDAGPRGPRGVTEKALYHILVTPERLEVNDTPVRNLRVLERFLAQQGRPVITFAAHRCVSGARVAEIMNLAQDHTDTPITFATFGSLADPQCQ